MTAHRPRGTVVTLLFEGRGGDAFVALRTGHRDLRLGKSYHNFRGMLGRKQQEFIFGGSSKKQKLDVTFNSEGKENVEVAQVQDRPKREDCGNMKSNGMTVDGLLAGVDAISGGNFTFNVHNHYR